jgi:CHAD domain-containing protein
MKAIAEYELKLDAPEGFELPDLGGEPLETRVFTSVYYDTADRSLTGAGLTLRRRTERGRSVWQLKLPAGDARLELEEPGGPAGPPDTLARLLTAHLRHGGFTPVAELRTRRHGVLVARNGTTAEVTVDGVAVMDARRVVEEFVEVEVELRDGTPKSVAAIAKAIERAGARRSDGTPKLFRVLRVTADAGDDREALPALQRRLHAQLRAVLANDPGTRLGRDPESLHDMRVAVRRARALFRAGAVLYTEDVTALEDELRWLGEKLGAARDLDVLVDRLRRALDELDADDRATGRALVQTLERRRRGARASLLRALAGARYLTLLDRLQTTIDGLTPSGTETTLDRLAGRQLAQLRKRVRSTPDDPADDELHALRKRGKRVRYAFELAGNDGAVKRAKAFQDVLGEHQDSVVAEATLREIADPATATAAGRLVEREHEARAEARASWRKAWKRLERATR